MDNKKCVFCPIWVRLMAQIPNGGTISQACRACLLAYQPYHTSVLKKYGLLLTEKKGRENIIHFTRKGLKVKKACKLLVKVCGGK